MKRYLALMSVIMGLFLLLFLAAESLHIPILTNPELLLSAGGLSAALIGVGLLVADILLPVPSSLVMVSHGALFGMWAGAAVSLLGRTGSFSLGYFLGRKSTRMTVRFLDEESITKADALLDQWGLMAIVGTRPLPILSETTSIAAGMAKVPFGQALLAAILGSVPEALLFAMTGAWANSFANASFIFIGVILLMLLVWLFTYLKKRRGRQGS